MRHVVPLSGCTLEPMAAYLKALAVLRLVSEQADAEAKAWWKNSLFFLESSLDEPALVEFFLHEYKPTPIVAPWNGGSGFSEGDSREGIDAILNTGSGRFAEYKATINEILSWPEFGGAHTTLAQMFADVRRHANKLRPGKAREELLKNIADVEEAAANSKTDLTSLLSLTTQEIKETAKSVHHAVSNLRTAAKKILRESGKHKIIPACRNKLRDRAVDWIDSAVVLRTAADPIYPPILGSGGNEGRLDYTHSFMKRVTSLLFEHRPRSESLLRNALFSSNSDQLSIAPVGQLDPGRAGGYNQGPEIETKNFPTNDWNFVFAMEGAVAWTSGAGRRQGVVSHGAMCSPFTVRPAAVGYASAEKQDEKDSRAEVWMPVWEQPCRFEELRALLREGRVEWGGKPVDNAMEFAEAAASLGTDRGISAFQRYTIVKRRGESYIAVPLARVPVREKRHVDLLQQLDPLLNRIDSFASRFKSEIPAQFRSRRRQIDNAIYDFALRGGPERMQSILAALGRMEQYFATRNLQLEPKLDRPLAGLSAQWLLAADDGSINFRIAAALASIAPSGDVGSIRANLSPVDPQKPWAWIDGSGQTAWRGNKLEERMAGALKRRLIDAERLNCNSFPLWASVRVSPQDAVAFLNSDGVDESRMEELLFGLMVIRWHDAEALAEVKPQLFASCRAKNRSTVIPRVYALLKHLFISENLKDLLGAGEKIKPEPAILSLLSAGRIKEACEIAQRRLRISGFQPTKASFPDEPSGINGIRLSAALLIPIHSMQELSRLVLSKGKEVAA